MGCVCSCRKPREEQCESGELRGLMPQPGTVRNYQSTSSEGIPLLPPLPPLVRKVFLQSQQRPGASGASGASSPAKSGQQGSKSPKRPAMSASIPIIVSAQPAPSQEPLTGSPQPSTSTGSGHSQLLGVPFVRELELSPKGLAYMKPIMGTIVEESTDIESDGVVEARNSRSGNADGGQDTGEPGGDVSSPGSSAEL